MTGLFDEAIRLQALEHLGAHGDALAREALENGAIEIRHGVKQWQGSLGKVEGHRVTLLLPAELWTRARATPSATDALTAALAAAVASVPGNALVELEITPRTQGPGSPFRGRSTPPS